MTGRGPCTAYVALGSNLGDGVAHLQQAIRSLANWPNLTLGRQSSFYRTAPVDADGPDYTNAVVAITTPLTAPDLLQVLQAIEHLHGRTRAYRNAPRTLDLDLLLYGDGQIDSPQLVVPHPRMALRAFVLVPLAEIAPSRVSAAQLGAVQEQTITKL
ncbi:MAG: 2-amino-4-hydroxy-6-hydroxymethyldihydropteridine diphosphokinase [Pseudomonadota bacterium]